MNTPASNTTFTTLATPDPSAYFPSTPAIPANKFDVFKYLKLLGMELLSFVLFAIYFKMLLAPLFASLAVIATNGNPEAMGWGKTISLFLSPFVYGLLVGRSGKDLFPRISMQLGWNFFFGIFGMLLMVNTPLAFALMIGIVGAMLGVGCWLGSFIAKNPKSESEIKTENEVKPTTVTSVTLEMAKMVGGVAVGLGLVVGLNFLNIFLTAEAQSAMYVGKDAPATVFESAEDVPWTLDDHKGKVVVLEYWSPMCGPCVGAMPWLKQLNEKYSKHDDFKMISVSSGDRQQSIDLFEKKDADWMLAFMPEESSDGDFKPQFVPMAYVIGRDGKVVAAGIHTSKLEEVLEPLFQDRD